MNNHTPGPWISTGWPTTGTWIVSSVDVQAMHIIAQLPPEGKLGADEKEIGANARLLVNAPEMYTGLENCMVMLHNNFRLLEAQGDCTPEELHGAVYHAQQILNKVEGI